jgi:hypothetical protein
MSFDALRKQRSLLPIMRLGNGPASGLEDLPWNALFGQRVQELRREGAVHHIGKLACIVVDPLRGQVPDHAYFYPSCSGSGWDKRAPPRPSASGRARPGRPLTAVGTLTPFGLKKGSLFSQ